MSKVMYQAYSQSGGQAVAGFWTVTQHIMGHKAQVIFNILQNAHFP